MSIFDLNRQSFFGSGSFSSNFYILDIDKKVNPTDYQIVNQLIGQIDINKGIKNPNQLNPNQPNIPEMINKNSL